MGSLVDYIKHKTGGGNSSKEEKPFDAKASLEGIKYVIFPDRKFAQWWDFLMIFTIFYYTFTIPYELGISGGYAAVTNKHFSRFNIILNIVFIIDTFLSFFRAYRDQHGILVYSLRRISRHYVLSGWFFINLLASMPTTAVLHSKGKKYLGSGNDDPLDDPQLRILFIFEVFKLFRLLRIKKLLSRSVLLTTMWEHINITHAVIIKFLFIIIIVQHWLACIWGFIAFREAGSFGDDLANGVNWIGNWYQGSFVEGGMNPIGWDNHIERYMLCLFWAIQTITSIGYGNIAPVTTIEYTFGNLLMMLSGFFWAYIIGSLVDAVSSGNKVGQEYINRMDQANEMVRDFTSSRLPESVVGTATAVKASKRVRRFITLQRDRATHKNLDSHSGPTLSEIYPTLDILSPELKKVSALHLIHDYIETVPYLSSTFLSPDEQAEIALKCVTLEFATGETFSEHDELGRGILIFRKGFGVASRLVEGGGIGYKIHPGYPFDVNEVLVEDEYYKEWHLTYHFIGFSKALFIPRSAIMDILSKNERAWKECARWRYFQGALLLHHLGRDLGKAI